MGIIYNSLSWLCNNPAVSGSIAIGIVFAILLKIATSKDTYFDK